MVEDAEHESLLRIDRLRGVKWPPSDRPGCVWRHASEWRSHGRLSPRNGVPWISCFCNQHAKVWTMSASW